jgi:hypothetical protein
MVKWIIAFGSVVLLGAQEKGQNPDLKYLPAWGISVMRPPKPKNEEWDLKDAPARLSASKLSVSHKVDDLAIDFTIVAPAPDEGLVAHDFDPKAEAAGLIKGLSESPNYKDAKQKGEVRSQKLPGNAASGVNAYYVEMTCKTQDDKSLEWRVWTFVAKENRSLFLVWLITGEGMYTKYNREIQYILSSIKTWKLEKK